MVATVATLTFLYNLSSVSILSEIEFNLNPPVIGNIKVLIPIDSIHMKKFLRNLNRTTDFISILNSGNNEAEGTQSVSKSHNSKKSKILLKAPSLHNEQSGCPI